MARSGRGQDGGEVLTTRGQQGMGDRLKLWGGVGAGALLALFFFQNLQTVEVHFLWFNWDIRMTFALVASAVVGIVAALAVATFGGRGNKQK